MLVVGGLHVAAELVGRSPELGLEAEVGGGVVRLFCHLVLVGGQLSLVAAGNRKVPESATGSIGFATAELSASLPRCATRKAVAQAVNAAVLARFEPRDRGSR